MAIHGKIRWVIILTITLAALIGLFESGIETLLVTDRIETLRPWLDGLRLGVLALLIIAWGPLVRWQGRRRFSAFP